MDRTIDIDLDGVLADFDTSANKIFGMTSRQYEDLHGNDKFWETLVATKNFYYDLELMPDAMELYNAVAHLNPVILTGCKPQFTTCIQHKKDWVKKHFGPNQKVIVCESKHKSNYMKAGDIMIDDWPHFSPLWVAKGGIWIHHTSAQNSIAELKKLGLI